MDMPPPCICNRWSDILKGLEVVKFRALLFRAVIIFCTTLDQLATTVTVSPRLKPKQEVVGGVDRVRGHLLN